MAVQLQAFLDTNALFSKNIAEHVPLATIEFVKQKLPVEHVSMSIYVADPSVRERRFQIAKHARRAFSDTNLARKFHPGSHWPSEVDVVEASLAQFDDLLKECKINVVALDIAKVDWGKMIESALERRPPFEEHTLFDGTEDEKRPKEKGFRDALIVTTFSQFIQSFPAIKDLEFAVVTGDKRAGEAVNAIDDKRVKVFSNLSELQGFINETIAELDRVQVSLLQAAIIELLHAANGIEEIRKHLLNTFKRELSVLELGYIRQSMDSFAWDSPVFQKKSGQVVLWTISTTIKTALYRDRGSFTWGNITYSLSTGPTSDGTPTPVGILGPDGKPIQSAIPEYQIPDNFREDRFLTTFKATASTGLDKLSDFEIVKSEHVGRVFPEPNWYRLPYEITANK